MLNILYLLKGLEFKRDAQRKRGTITIVSSRFKAGSIQKSSQYGSMILWINRPEQALCIAAPAIGLPIFHKPFGQLSGVALYGTWGNLTAIKSSAKFL